MENNSPVGGAITCILLNIYLNAAGVNRSVAVTREKKPLVHVTETPLWFSFFLFLPFRRNIWIHWERPLRRRGTCLQICLEHNQQEPHLAPQHHADLWHPENKHLWQLWGLQKRWFYVVKMCKKCIFFTHFVTNEYSLNTEFSLLNVWY